MPAAVRIIALITFLFLMCANAMAQSPIARANLEADIENLEQEIADLELFAQMKSAADYIPEQSRCMTYLEMAAGYRDELQVLNQQYAGRADATYREQAETLLEYNKRAIEEYESCFGSVAAQRYDKIRDAYVYPYDTFRARYNVLSDWFGESTNLAARLGELQREIDELKRQLQDMEEMGDFIGTITSTFRTVYIERGSDRIAVVRNTRVYLNDVIVTGPRGRTRIELNDRIEERNAGPTVLNVGSNSEVVMEKFTPHAPRERGVIDVIRGAVKIFTEGFGGRAAFSVRTGTSLCGIRGTEVLIEYDDRTNESKHYLLHGTADLTTRAGTQILKPMHVIETASNGRSTERRFSESEYATASQAEGENFARPLNEIATSRYSATFHLKRYLDAYVNEDYLVASEYFVGEVKNEIRAALNNPDELRAFLADKTLPTEWRFGCLTCTAPDQCAATIAFRLSNSPQELSYFEWLLRPNGNLWGPETIKNLDQEAFSTSFLSCPAPDQ